MHFKGKFGGNNALTTHLAGYQTWRDIMSIHILMSNWQKLLKLMTGQQLQMCSPLPACQRCAHNTSA